MGKMWNVFGDLRERGYFGEIVTGREFVGGQEDEDGDYGHENGNRSASTGHPDCLFGLAGAIWRRSVVNSEMLRMGTYSSSRRVLWPG